MSLVYLRELDQHTKFAIWRIEEDEHTLSNQLQLGALEEQKLISLSNGKRRLHWLATRVLLRTLLNTTSYIDCPSDSNGKPYLGNFPQKISLTHSFDYAGAIISSAGEVGIDMEIIKSKVERIAHKFLKEEELHFITQGANRLAQLYACWSAKEAVYKLQGNAGVSFLHNMTISPFEYEEDGILQLYLESEQHNRFFNVHYEKFNDYLLAYVVE